MNKLLLPTIAVVVLLTVTSCAAPSLPDGIKKVEITPSTRDIAHALYYDSVMQRLEKYGTSHFPQKDGKKLYGQLMISIPVLSDGSIYEAHGGPWIKKSSGSPDLDREAIQIARKAAPYGRFPRPTKNDEVWELVFPFNFTQVDSPTGGIEDQVQPLK